MKGAILRSNPGATLVDVTHALKPGDIRAGAFALLQAYAYFPPGTVHVAVVDPGVGSPRAAIAIRTREYLFVGPDNGVLSYAAGQAGIVSVRRITNPALRLRHLSPTFHGRDLFAPAAGFLSRGGNWTRLGPRVTAWRVLDWPTPVQRGRSLRGEVVWVDHFGNAITNLPVSRVTQTANCRIRQRNLGRPVRHYQAVAPGQAMVLPGSCGFLEIAVNGGSAARQLGLRLGTMVTATLDPNTD
jgi:hypothetical protein